MSINTKIVLGLVGFGGVLALIAGAALLWLAITWSQDTSPDGDGPWEAQRRAQERRQYAAGRKWRMTKKRSPFKAAAVV
jgi:hypothetical protein